MLSVLIEAFTIKNLLMMNIGLSVGILIGAAPGLSVAFAVTVLLTMTYQMDSVSAIVLLLGAYCGGMYGGSIAATLINTPGTSNAVCTAIEGYPMARKGRAGDALKCAVVASTIGGIVSCIALMFFAPQLAKVILKIGSPEYFALCCFGVLAAVGLEGTSLSNILKGVASGAIGLLFACVGSDPVYGTSRFAFGNYNLISGIKVVSVMLGAYALSQVMVNCKDVTLHGDEKLKIGHVGKATLRWIDILKHWKVLVKSSFIGILIGAIPGTGGATAAMMAYNEARRSSKHPEEFGEGSVEGIIASETANNAVTGAAMIPMLTLGIPGDTVMAIMLSALTMQGVTPGANLFTSGDTWVWIIMCSLVLINVFMYLQGSLCVNLFAKVAKIPQSIMIPCIVVMCTFGAFAINNTSFEIFVMVLFGLIGYIMKKYGFPVTPMCISLVLGSLFEKTLRRSLTLSNGDVLVFFKRPLSCVIMILAVLVMFYPMITTWITKNKEKKK